jgi:hypothetical protein
MMKAPGVPNGLSGVGYGEGDIPDGIAQHDWLAIVKNRSCVGCHQLGQLSTRVKHALSHRSRALEKLRPVLRQLVS